MENEITKNLVFLADSLTNLERVLLHLEEKGIISTNERDGILLLGTPLEKNMRFLDMIKRKDYNANKNLILEILRTTNNKHCADKIEGSKRQTETTLRESRKYGVAKLGQMLGDKNIAEPTTLSRHPADGEIPQHIRFGVTAPNTCYTRKENETLLTWKSAFGKLRESRDGGGESVVDIMNIISFLSPDNIPTQMAISILQKMGKVSDFADETKYFDIIEKYSMINYSAENIISVHRLVQEVIRIQLEERGEYRTLLNEIVKVLKEMLKSEEISLKELVHVQSVWRHLAKEKELIEEHGEMLWQICIKLLHSGKYQDLLDFSVESGELVESALVKNKRLSLRMKHMKGKALRYLGEYSEALEVLKETYERQKTSFGEEHEDCLDTSKQIGAVYNLLEKYEESMQIYKDAMDKAERIFGKEHLKPISIKHDIAMVFYSQDKFKEALKLCAEVLKVRERLLGVEHPSTLSTMHNIAAVKYNLNDYLEALKELTEILKIQERVLELNHPHTLNTKYWIAATFYHLGRYEDSLQLLQEVHEKQIQILGPRHRHTITTDQWIKIVEMQITFQRSLTEL